MRVSLARLFSSQDDNETSPMSPVLCCLCLLLCWVHGWMHASTQTQTAFLSVASSHLLELDLQSVLHCTQNRRYINIIRDSADTHINRWVYKCLGCSVYRRLQIPRRILQYRCPGWILCYSYIGQCKRQVQRKVHCQFATICLTVRQAIKSGFASSY